MVTNLQELAQLVGGKMEGNPSTPIKGISGIKEAEEGDITFVANPKYFSWVGRTRASAIIVGLDSRISYKNLLMVENPYLAFGKIVEFFFPRTRKPLGISPMVFRGEGVEIGEESSIYPMVYLGNHVRLGSRVTIYPGVYVADRAKIGEDTIIYSNVTIREDTSIGRRVIIHSGVTIGCDGFGFAWDGSRHAKIPQVGIVEIEDDVEIGANTAIDRATIGKTVIKRGTKIDNLVQIGHNVIVEENVILAGQVGISGSSRIGKNVILAGQVGIANHLNIGDNARVGAKSGVAQDVPAGETYSGIPAFSHREWLRVQPIIKKLPELSQEVKELKKRLDQLESLIRDSSM